MVQAEEGTDGLEQLNCLVLQCSTVSDASKKTTTPCTKFHDGVGFMTGGIIVVRNFENSKHTSCEQSVAEF